VEWEKVFAHHTPDNGLISKINKESSSKQSSQFLKTDRRPEKTFFRRRHRFMEKCSTSLITREMQVKTSVRHHLTL
jgi:hypothetical protein